MHDDMYSQCDLTMKRWISLALNKKIQSIANKLCYHFPSILVLLFSCVAHFALPTRLFVCKLTLSVSFPLFISCFHPQTQAHIYTHIQSWISAFQWMLKL